MGIYSKIPLICNDCDYEWETTIHIHINGKFGCPSCSDTIPLTYNRFISRAHEVHGVKFNYNKVTSNHIKGNKSHIPIICNDCGHIPIICNDCGHIPIICNDCGHIPIICNDCGYEWSYTNNL